MIERERRESEEEAMKRGSEMNWVTFFYWEFNEGEREMKETKNSISFPLLHFYYLLLFLLLFSPNISSSFHIFYSWRDVGCVMHWTTTHLERRDTQRERWARRERKTDPSCSWLHDEGTRRQEEAHNTLLYEKGQNVDSLLFWKCG